MTFWMPGTRRNLFVSGFRFLLLARPDFELSKQKFDLHSN